MHTWENRILIDIAVGMLRKSTWGGSAGLPLQSFFDVDGLFAVDYRFDADKTATVRRSFVRQIITNLERILQECKIDRVAFIDKGGMGPVGGLWLALTTAFELNFKLLLIRPWKELISARIKGEEPKQDERFLIVTDVITTGRTVVEASNVLQLYGAKAVAVYAITERDDEKEAQDKRRELLGDNIEIHVWRKASELIPMAPAEAS